MALGAERVEIYAAAILEKGSTLPNYIGFI